jgi:hypothetical protein
MDLGLKQIPVLGTIPNASDDKPAHEIYASWSIEEIKQFLKEVEAELRNRQIPHVHRALRPPCPRVIH